jgi:sporulation protein YlmC with PRC-barrel domain
MERDLALTVLDHQLVDADGERCGRVDDIELDLRDGVCVPVALVVGRDAMARRVGAGRFGALVRRLLPVADHRVSWDQLDGVTHVVKLRRPAGTYGLARSDARLAPYIRRIPGG